MKHHRILSFSLLLFSRTYFVPCSTLESRNPTWAVSAAGSFSSVVRPTLRTSLRSKKALDIFFDPRRRSRFLSSLWLSVSYGASEGRTSPDFVDSAEVPFFFLLPSWPSRCFSFILSLSLLLFFLLLLLRASQRIQTRARSEKEGEKGGERKTERERRSRDGRRREKSRRRRRSRRSGEDKVSFYSPPGTRSVPFHGAYAYTYVYFCV